ncbi:MULTISPECIES: class I SAM-dependent methyltransferase [unclassified Xanthomonas]|uniref:class I SAM-dependent methyltransferase n=1 Tax=unclassified Xanthomonas TaxID=2643310 RepID=UPI00197FD558|nr:class I SAM-dependent methyltransferase [Xanthomonas sp.]MBN6150361.1 class I SAM-dependent methyltransferase [Xanthomonas sp.]MDR6673346.1 SAM-dependent methyltransferase [Xanthomonas translucens]
MKRQARLHPASDRACPGCAGREVEHFADERIDPNKVSDFTYASRKTPEFMCLRLVRCAACDLVFAPRPPEDIFLSQAYSEAAYDSTPEAAAAAASYAQALAPHIKQLSDLSGAVDVGAGSGPLLPYLQRFGFKSVVGVEPSRAAINAAPEAVKALLIEGMFDPKMLKGQRVSLICSFMTLEHVANPGELVRSAYTLLEPGGMLAVVVHNWRAPLNRALGLRSPIIDVEHLQLFSHRAARALLSSNGFQDVTVKAIRNAYPLRYWLRLTPLPAGVKAALLRVLDLIGISGSLLPLRVGNIMAIGVKPARDPQ